MASTALTIEIDGTTHTPASAARHFTATQSIMFAHQVETAASVDEQTGDAFFDAYLDALDDLAVAPQADAILAGIELLNAREAEHQADVAAAGDEFEAYWASSASASVMRDYRAGRVVEVQ